MQTIFNIIRKLREALMGRVIEIDEVKVRRFEALAPTQLTARMIRPGITLRNATYQDMTDLVRLERLCYDGYLAWQLTDFQHDFQHNPSAVYWVLEADSQVIGAITGRFKAREAHISHLLIVPHYQRLGLASVLIRQWLSMLKELEIPLASLEVRESNEVAQALYRQHGFVEVRRIPHYYTIQKEAAIYMEFRRDG